MNPIDLGLLFVTRLLKIHTERTSATSPQLKTFINQHLFAPLIKKHNYISTILQDLKDRDIYHLTDPLGVQVSLLRIGDDICVLGPYITDAPSNSKLKKRFSDIGLDEKHLSAFKDYVLTLPFLIIDSIYFASHTLMQGAVGLNSKAIVYYVDLNESTATRLQAESAGIPVSAMPQRVYETVVTADDNINQYYQVETTLIEQMASGQTANAVISLNRMSALRDSRTHEKTLDSDRMDAAFLCALMRQAVIKAGVLPVQAEIKSRYFLKLIRKTDSFEALNQVVKDMLSQFCDMIRKEQMSSLSPKVRQVVQLVMADLSGQLDVVTLAAQVGLSPNYLSATFKKEMGQTFSSYVRDKRLESAVHFLKYTNMSIHDIAICVGIKDFSYFTKMFREKYGVTPTEYRHSK